MLQNARVAAFTVSGLLREKQQGRAGKVTHPPPSIQIGVYMFSAFFPFISALFSILELLAAEYWKLLK